MRIITYKTFPFVISNKWLDRPDIPKEFLIEHGWGNGYLAISKNHPLYGMDYNDIPYFDVNGGLTYANMITSMYNHHPEVMEKYKIPKDLWVIGFDTNHYGDNMSRWPDEQSVLNETLRLQKQIDEYYIHGNDLSENT